MLSTRAVVLISYLVASATVALGQTPILLNGTVYDGNGGPLAAGPTYHIISGPGSCGLYVPPGQTLTIQAGAIIKINGCVSVAGTLMAVGTATAPIVLTSVHDDFYGGDTNGNGGLTSPAPGDWQGIDILGDAQFEHCRARYGGQGSNGGMIQLRHSASTVLHCILEYGGSNGILDAYGATIDDCDFDHLAEIPVEGLDLKRLQFFTNNRAMMCAGGDFARITTASQLTSNLTMSPMHSINGTGVFVIQTAFVASPTVPPGVTWTFPANTIAKFKGCVMRSTGGAIDVQGGLAGPVVLTSLHDDNYGGDTEKDGTTTLPQPGDFRGLELLAGDTSTFTGTILRYGAVPTAVRLDGSSATFLTCLVEYGAGDAFQFHNTATPPPHLLGCVIQNNAGRATRDMDWSELLLCGGNVTSNNAGGDHFHVTSGFINAPFVIDPGMYPGDVIEVSNRPTINNGGSLTLEAGVIVKWGSFNFNTGISVNSGGQLLCNGTARRPVVFTTMLDDSQGGDTNGDGAATTPAPGDWDKFWISSGSSAATNRLDHVVMRYGGRSTAMLECQNPMTVIDSLRIEHSEYDGIWLSGAASPVVNLVVDRAGRDGVRLINGTFDVLHATVSGSGEFGIRKNGSWNGDVRNSISWGNALGNFTGILVGDVWSSNGGFAGQNGNLSIDPQFVAPTSGDLHLSGGSPCLGAAGIAAAIATVKDHDETSRIQDHTLAAGLLPDMGAFERAAYHMDVTGEAVLGTDQNFTLQGPGGIGLVIISLTPTSGFLLPPFGFVLIGAPNATLAPGVVLMGQPATFNQPANPIFYATRYDVQGLGLQLTSPLTGGFTNVDRNRLRF